MPSDKFREGIIGLLQRARILKPEIGNYENHFMNESSNFRVKISNGWLNIPSEWARDQEVQPNWISEADIIEMTNRFELLGGSDSITEEVNKTEMLSEKPTGFWQKFLSLLGLK